MFNTNVNLQIIRNFSHLLPFCQPANQLAVRSNSTRNRDLKITLINSLSHTIYKMVLRAILLLSDYNFFIPFSLLFLLLNGMRKQIASPNNSIQVVKISIHKLFRTQAYNP